MITFGSLFSGIGGFDLGFERAGMRCAWQVEIDPFCRGILSKRWPDVKRYSDIRDVRNPPYVDVVCGGFPCQPHSLAGNREASNDERDLWPEFYRIICEVRPRWVVGENVRGLLSSEAGQFFGGILRDLADLRYDAEWQVLPASAFGAIHERERVFIVAYPHGEGLAQRGYIFDQFNSAYEKKKNNQPVVRFTDMVDCEYMSSARNWPGQSIFLRKHHGLSARMDRVKSIGNAVIPQAAEWIGRRIVEVTP